MPSATERSLLTAPGPVARAASQPQQAIWMLRQADRVRESHVSEVERLGGQAGK